MMRLLQIHCAILSFIQNYDGLYLGNDDLWYEQEAEKIERVLEVAKSGQQQYDNFILSYFKKRYPVKLKNVIKQIQSDIGGEQFLWTSFLIFRLSHLRDQGYFDIVSSPPILDITLPAIYDECWQLRQEKSTIIDEYDYEELKTVLNNDPADFETEKYIDHLLHTIPLSEQSKKFLFTELEQSKNKNRIVICLLVRLNEFISDEERKALIKKYECVA